MHYCNGWSFTLILPEIFFDFQWSATDMLTANLQGIGNLVDIYPVRKYFFLSMMQYVEWANSAISFKFQLSYCLPPAQCALNAVDASTSQYLAQTLEDICWNAGFQHSIPDISWPSDYQTCESFLPYQVTRLPGGRPMQPVHSSWCVEQAYRVFEISTSWRNMIIIVGYTWIHPSILCIYIYYYVM